MTSSTLNFFFSLSLSSYTPQGKEKGYIKPYAEIHQLHPPGMSHDQSLQHLGDNSSNGIGQPLLSTHEGKISHRNYDILRPPTDGNQNGCLLEPFNEDFHHGGEDQSQSGCSDRSSKSPPHTTSSQNSPSIRAPEWQGNHNGKLRPEDTDTYVFMAPVTDFGSDPALDASRSPLMFQSEMVESDSSTRWVSLARSH